MKKAVILGFIAGASLLILYIGILSLAESFSHAIFQFFRMWYWILILVAGFGLEVGLFVFIKEKQKIVSGKTLVASGGVSTGAMIACCLHHLTDVLSLMGLAAVAVFLTQYQVWFIILGILSNLIGITIMLEIIQKNNLAGEFLKGRLAYEAYDMTQIKKVVVGASLILLFGSFFLIKNQVKKQELSANQVKQQELLTTAINLPSKADSRGGISFVVTPIDLSFEKPVKFEVKINTHSGSLDFDLTKISILEDDLGNQYQPLNWQGSPPGGHHRSGTLSFPQINSKAKKIKLTIEDTILRIFKWDLK